MICIILYVNLLNHQECVMFINTCLSEFS